MPDLFITPYACPVPGCVAGLISDAVGHIEKCLHCAGTGLTDDPMGGADRAPRPPAVMRTACADCAFRSGSPELEQTGACLPVDEPFFCHQGLPLSADGHYQPVATFRGLPLGAMVCAGWWAARTGEQLPARPYREVPLGEDDVDRQFGQQAKRNLDRALAPAIWPAGCATPVLTATTTGTGRGAVTDWHTGWDCRNGASLLAGVQGPGRGGLPAHHGVIYVCPDHQAEAEARISAGGHQPATEPAPPGHRWDPWPCGHITTYGDGGRNLAGALTRSADSTEG